MNDGNKCAGAFGSARREEATISIISCLENDHSRAHTHIRTHALKGVRIYCFQMFLSSLNVSNICGNDDGATVTKPNEKHSAVCSVAKHCGRLLMLGLSVRGRNEAERVELLSEILSHSHSGQWQDSRRFTLHLRTECSC